MVGGRYISSILSWLAAMMATSAFAGPIYTVTGLSTPDAYSSSASALNSSAQIAGTSTLNDGSTVAFFADAGETRQLDALDGGFSSAASGLNSSGSVAGTSYSESGAQAVLWTIAGSVGLGTLGGSDSYATDLNDDGVVVGAAATPSGDMHAYSYNGRMRDLGTLPGGSWSAAYGVSASGVVVGYGDAGSGAFGAILWTTTGGMTQLGTLGGRSSYAMDVNDAGSVAGHAQVYTGYLHAFLYDGGRMTDLGTLGEGNSYAYGVNNLGQVVGYSNLSGSELTHAFVYADGGMRDLNSLIAADSGWILTEAYDINDAGQIAGAGLYNGEQRAFLLDVTVQTARTSLMMPMAYDAPLVENPEPSSISLIALGAGLLLLPRLLRKFMSRGR